MTSPCVQVEESLQRQLGSVILGMREVVHGLVIAVIARGHVLLQGPPGLGKTLLSKALARCLGGTFQRIQGTADLMPSDITGVHVYDSQKQTFVFRQGPLFADVVLMDEINRAGPKTQSAVLEAMEERQVTIDRERFALAAEFLVIATQNPREFEGTYPLPESQLDRFMLQIEVRYVPRDQEVAILRQYGAIMGNVRVEDAALEPLAASLLENARAQAASVHASDELLGYILEIAAATRASPQLSLGLSTRGVLALMRAARVEAALRDAEFVTPDDVKSVLTMAASHRVALAPEAVLEGISPLAVLGRIVEQVPVPR